MVTPVGLSVENMAVTRTAEFVSRQTRMHFNVILYCNVLYKCIFLNKLVSFILKRM
jgi:hypothetical protein